MLIVDRERLLENVVSIARHDELYFNQSSPEISDAEYDALVRETEVLLEELRSVSPRDELVYQAQEVLESVGAFPEFGTKVEHPSVMGSLAKATEASQIVQWIKGVECDVRWMLKMDGLAIRIVYDGGNLVLAATRGNGSVGQDVTGNIQAIDSIPNKIAYNGHLEMRGEVILHKSTFGKLRDQGENFTNPRNAASGSVMQKDATVTGSRGLGFRCYWVEIEDELETLDAMRDFVRSNFRRVQWVEMDTVDERTEDWITEHVIEPLTEKRPSLDFCIDGIVFLANSVEVYHDMGWTGKCPNAGIAYKFPPEQKESRVVGIRWQTGRTGKETPVADIEPTYIDGSTVRHITLHNYANVLELDLQIGDTVLFEKAGDIIPQVVRVTDRQGRPEGQAPAPESINYPHECPSCGAATELTENGVNVMCRNLLCPAQLARSVEHYLETLEVKGLGPGTVATLLSEGMVRGIPDLYTLEEKRLASLEGWGARSAEMVVGAVMAKRKLLLWQFVAALGIPGVGPTTSKAIAKRFQTLGNIREASQDDLEKVEGVGGITSRAVVTGLRTMQDMLTRVLEHVTVEDVKEATGPLAGMSFCLTGKMPSCRARKEIEAEIETAGGEVKKSVGKGLTYLVQANPMSESGKSKKAKSLGTQIISEEALMDMMD